MKRNLKRVRQIFLRAQVLDMKALVVRFPGRSQRSLFRDLTALGYRSSYTHGGGFYTLTEIPDFDEWGLWFRQEVGFSRAGTLKETAVVQVEKAPDGRTHAELEHLLRVRVHNALLELFREGRVRRELHEGRFLYVNADAGRAAEQVERRREGDRAKTEDLRDPTAEESIEILVEALRGAAGIPPVVDVASRLAARGVHVGRRRVRQVYESHGLVPGKKTAPLSLPPSRR